MAIVIDLQADLRAVQRALGGISREAPVIIFRAINRTLTPVQARAAKEIAADIKLRQSAARKFLRVERANRRSLIGEVVASGRRIPLIQFSARQTAKGVTYDLGRGRSLLPRAFINRAPKNFAKQHPQAVYRRLEVGGKMVPRDPIHQKFGPSVPRAFVSGKVERAMHVVARTRWVIEMQRQLKFFISQFGGR